MTEFLKLVWKHPHVDVQIQVCSNNNPRSRVWPQWVGGVKRGRYREKNIWKYSGKLKHSAKKTETRVKA